MNHGRVAHEVIGNFVKTLARPSVTATPMATIQGGPRGDREEVLSQS